MKRIYTLAALLFIGVSSLSAQNRTAYYELGFGLGTLNYSGDVGTTISSESILNELRPNIAVFGKKHFNSHLAIGLQASYGWIYSEDGNHSHANRGVEFETSMFQINPFVEVSLIPFGKYQLEQKFTIFIKAGGGMLGYDPNPKSAVVYPDDFEIRQNAYGTYNYFGGGGLKFRLNYTTILTVEAYFHGAGTDDLDGVLHLDATEQGANDTYGGVMISLSKAFF